MGASFDLERYLRNSKALQVDDLPWDAIHEHPVTAGELRFLRYMMNIETHTIVYLKELLGTKVIEDGEVTAFLSCWAYEEFFHGRAQERFLRAFLGDVRNETRDRLANATWAARAAKRALAPAVSAALPDFSAIHMTWGAAQECTTLHGYESLARQTAHPLLREMMLRIVKDERRHFAFYANQAERRLTATPAMQRPTRWAMDRLWRPVGVGTLPAAESDFAAWYLFRDDAGQAALREVDAAVSRLPGMAGWDGLSRRSNAAIARFSALGPEAEAAMLAHHRADGRTGTERDGADGGVATVSVTRSSM